LLNIDDSQGWIRYSKIRHIKEIYLGKKPPLEWFESHWPRPQLEQYKASQFVKRGQVLLESKYEKKRNKVHHPTYFSK
jgi:hypothetical protein